MKTHRGRRSEVPPRILDLEMRNRRYASATLRILRVG